MRRLAVVLGCLCLAVLPACGDDGDVAPDPVSPQDQAVRDGGEAERIAFHIYDFPSIWTAEGDLPDKTVVPEGFNDCGGGAIPEDQISARRAAALRLNPAVVAASQVTLVKDATLLDNRAASIDTEEFATCMEGKVLPILQARVPNGAALQEIDAARSTIEVVDGKGVRVAIILSGPGGSGRRVHLDFIYLRRGRAEAVLAMFASPDRFPAVVEASALSAVLGRLQASTG